MRSVVTLAVAGMAILAPLAASQGPGDYPHLVLTDGKTITVPGPAGPWDNSGVFPAVSGHSLTARLTYQAAAQPNNNVLWALLVSVNKTPLPLGLVPPPLLTMPPFVMLQPPGLTLSSGGFGQITLFVPAGLYGIDTYVQGIVFDASNSPALALSNGLRVSTAVPDFNVQFAFLRNFMGAGGGAMGSAGVIDIGGDTLKTLRPLGTEAPPEPVMEPHTPFPGSATVVTQDPIDQGGVNSFRFLPIVPNTPDEPTNPLARPLTKIVGSVTGTDTTITVEDTSYFPARGRLLIGTGAANVNMWANRTGSGESGNPPATEVVLYDGVTPTSFLNCQRAQLGSFLLTGPISFPHVAGQTVIGDFTMASSASARRRDRVCLDADNPDMPHVVIPSFTYDAGGDLGLQTRELDLSLYERIIDGLHGFMTFDHVTGEWRPIPGTAFPSFQGRWDPMVHVAPDRRSFVAALRVSGGAFGWDNAQDRLFFVRLDGLHWPASGAETWEVSFQKENDPTNPNTASVRSRAIWMPSVAVIGAGPDDYVAFVALKNKWKMSGPAPVPPGQGNLANEGFESVSVRDDLIVHDLFDVPLVQPGSAKGLPALPRPWITTQFGSVASGGAVFRFDPEPLVAADAKRMVVVGGPSRTKEDVFAVRNVGINADGSVSKIVVNISGLAVDFNGEVNIRSFAPGGHGSGGKGALSPDGTRVAFLRRDTLATTQRRDWINIALTSGATYGQVVNVYEQAAGFKESGDLQSDRVVSGLRFLDNNRLVFTMGRLRYDDPAGAFFADSAPGVDLFLYNVTTGVMSNLSHTDPTGTPFAKLGKINPGGSFASPSGNYVYLIRMGGMGTAGGSALPAGTPVANILGLNTATQQVFPVTGDEINGSALVGNLTLPASECVAPLETAASLRLVHAHGVQEGLTYFVAHRQDGAGGSGADDVFAVNRTTPFVAFAATQATLPGVHVSQPVPSPFSAKLAFARGDTADPLAARQHAFVVDLDNFLFERDVTSVVKIGIAFLGRVMAGSLHFIPPTGNAPDALVFSFGLGVMPGSGIAAAAVPLYYPLGTVSDPLAEPIPVLVPLIDTAFLGGDFRFYLPFARASSNP